MADMKVYELAKQLGVKSVFLMDKIRKEWKMPVKSHMESLSPDLVKKIKDKFSADIAKEEKSSGAKTKRKTVKKSSTVTKKSAASKVVKKTIKKSVTVTKSATESKLQKAPAKKPAPASIIRRRKADQKPLESVKKPDASEQASLGSKEKEASFKIKGAGSIRSDLVSVKNADPLQDDSWKEGEKEKEEFKKQIKKPVAEKEINIKFQATDFRKREMVFQPKKKRNLVSGSLKKTQITTPKVHKRVVKVHGEMQVSTLAKKMNVKRRDLIKKLKVAGVNTEDMNILDFETIALIIPDFGFEVKNTLQTEKDILKNLSKTNQKTDEKEFPYTPKPPVVTIMGHVDHGKTTLLDAIRKTKVAGSEAGGITQNIGAYSVVKNNKPITFIDTPGHEAFTAMRARGVQATDVVVIVVAATDGVMPQTVEAINHTQTAVTPMIVAINKMDAPGAQIDKIKQQMSKHKVIPEDWGGDVSFVPVSALKGDGIEALLEQIQVLAELQELKCQLGKPARGLVIESHLEKGRGSVVSILVQDGTLRTGETIIAGDSSGRVRQIRNDQGQVVKEVGAGFPVEVIGFNKLPAAGDSFDIVKNEKAAKELLELRRSKKQMENSKSAPSIEELLLRAEAKTGDGPQELSLILKADNAGRLEALKVGLDKISTEKVNIKIKHSAVGGITESDVMLASTVDGVILGFNVRPDSKANQISRDKSVVIKTRSIIYELLDDVTQMMLGKLKSEIVEEDKGTAEVREVFRISKVGTIAGSYVTDGVIPRNAHVRLVRDGTLVYDGKISSLKHFKEDVKEVKSGFECGISIENFNDIKPKDTLEVYVKKEIRSTEL